MQVLPPPLFNMKWSTVINWFKKQQVSEPEVSDYFTQPKLEDGDIITQEDGIYQQCPECGALVPQLVEVPDFNKMKPGENPLDMEAVKGNLQSLIDPRQMITGEINVETNESKLHCQCIVCGMPLKDKDGNTLFLN